MPASEDPGSGPVIHDHRRIDPVTGQVRGKHAASKPAAPLVPAGRARLVRSSGTGSSGTGRGRLGPAPRAAPAPPGRLGQGRAG